MFLTNCTDDWDETDDWDTRVASRGDCVVWGRGEQEPHIHAVPRVNMVPTGAHLDGKVTENL